MAGWVCISERVNQISYRIKLLVNNNCSYVQAELFQAVLQISGAMTSFLAIVISYCVISPRYVVNLFPFGVLPFIFFQEVLWYP